MINLTDEQKKLLNIVDNRTDFYFKVENATIDNYEIFDTIYEAHLYITLCRFCNNQQVAFPSYKTLADYCFCSKRTIINAMNSLVAKGLINKVSRKKEDQIVNDTNLYTVNNIKNIQKQRMKKSRKSMVQKRQCRRCTTPSAGSAPNKEQVIKNNYKKNHDHDNELDFFENLFKEFGINFTTTNKESVLRLRKSLSLKDVELYLRETYQAIKDNKDVVNVAALFSSKIAKGERQINIIKTEKPKTDKKDENKTIEKNIQEKKNLSPVLDLFKDKTASENVDLILENFNSLDPYDKLKIEEKAIILLCDEEKITENFVLTTKQKSPNIYFGMIRKYVETIMNDIKQTNY